MVERRGLRDGWRKQITMSRGTAVMIAVLYVALGYGAAMMLMGVGRFDIIAGALIIGTSLYVGTKT